MSASATDIRPAEVAPRTVAPDAAPAGGDPSPAPRDTHETVIAPRKGWIAVDWGEMWRQRELLKVLVERDIRVRYKQAMLGAMWAVLQPLTQVVLFSLIFGAGFNLAAKLSDGTGPAVPYPLFVFAALLPWQFFARALTEGGMSLVSQQNLLTKIYFPRLFVPSSTIGGALFDMLISSTIFGLMLGAFWLHGSFRYEGSPANLLLLPVLVLTTVLFASGLAYLLAALTVVYRDFRFIINFGVQLWMWISFIMIPVPDAMLRKSHWLAALYMNPMYGLAASYRKVLLGIDRGWAPGMLLASVAASVAIFFLGVFYFRRTERRFADIA